MVSSTGFRNGNDYPTGIIHSKRIQVLGVINRVVNLLFHLLEVLCYQMFLVCLHILVLVCTE